MKLRTIALSILLLFALPAPTGATVILLSDDRFVDSQFPEGGPTLHETPAAPFAPFDASVSVVSLGPNWPLAHATQSSVVSPSFMGGTGRAENGSDAFQDGIATSRFSLTFAVDEPTAYELSGFFEEVVSGFFGSVVLSGPGGVLFEESQITLEPDDLTSRWNFATAGVLAAGTYQLVLMGESDDVGGGRWSFGFTLVPEPSTLALTLAGLLALARLRRPRLGAP